MKRMRRSVRGHFVRRVITYVLVGCLVMNTSVSTLLALSLDPSHPFDPTAGVLGSDWITDPANPVINTDHGAIIHWRSFNTGGATGHDSITFNQSIGGVPDSMSAVLNRITSGFPTRFLGDLNANGRVFVVNPAGVMFGLDSTVNVSQLVVSGLGMTNDAFNTAIADSANPMVFDAGGTGSIETKGEIHADSVILAGKKVRNAGSIIAPDGLIVMAAGEKAYIAQDGSSVLVDVSEGYYSEGDTTPDTENKGLLRVNRGQIVLAAGDSFSRAIDNSSWLVAKGGTITAHAARFESEGAITTSPSTSGDGGAIHLTGNEAVVLQNGHTSTTGMTTASGSLSGNGGSITIESTNPEGTGTVTIQETHLITARGGTTNGNGGNIKITADHIEIAGDIDASPRNPAFENGTLTIDPSDITIANGVNAGAVDTIYEEDIEALSTGGTNLVVVAGESITVQDILDDLIAGGRGDIELHAPTIHFEDTVATDTVSTTTGDLVMVGGAGGINTGHLETGAAGLGAEPGDIHLSTTDGGDITTRDLTVKGGQTKGDIHVNADGELTVGTVVVGRDSAIDNDVIGGNAEATVYLGSGDDMFLNGPVTAEAHTTSSGDATASVRVFAGLNGATSGTGDATISDDLLARAESDAGTSYALVEVDTYGKIEWGPDADATAIGDAAQVLGVRETQDDVDGADEAHVIINERGLVPDLEAFPDAEETHMGDPVSGNVLDNDVDPDGGDIDVLDHTDPSHGTLTLDSETGSFTYTPDDPGFVGEDTFTYRATDEEGTITDPVTVTITMTNDLPSPVDDVANTHMNQSVEGNVLINDTDTNGDPLSVVLDGTAPSHGTVTLAEDGSFTYTPDAGYTGEDTFTYEVTDGQLDAGTPAVATGTVTVHIGNNLPVANNDEATTITGNPVSGNVLGNDTDLDGDVLSVVLDGTAPSNGTVTLNTDGSFTYTPDAGFVGEDTFTYEITDGQGGTEGPIVATVTICVEASLAPSLSPVAPGLERKAIEYSGIPALAKWVAKELGVPEAQIEIWMANGLASSRDIPPYETYARFRTAAVILKDDAGRHIRALTQVINEFASSTAPPTEEQMASIADAIASNAGADNQYGLAEEYLNALAQYISILNTDMGFSMSEAVELATANYVNQLEVRGNANVAAYVKSRLAAL